jgi:acyl carrier protein
MIEAMMTDPERLATLTRILRDLLGDDSIELTMQTAREDVPGWDSFCYVNFIVAVEAEYRIKLRIAEIESFANVGEIVHAIDAAQKR